jgi:hypothetical protein
MCIELLFKSVMAIGRSEGLVLGIGIILNWMLRQWNGSLWTGQRIACLITYGDFLNSLLASEEALWFVEFPG